VHPGLLRFRQGGQQPFEHFSHPTRQACDAPVQAGLDAAVAQCKATLQAAKAACNGDPHCIEQAEVVAFQCRDDARDAAKPGFAACRAGFKSCVQGCPPASPSGAFLN
jgi:hypothetical protein